MGCPVAQNGRQVGVTLPTAAGAGAGSMKHCRSLGDSADDRERCPSPALQVRWGPADLPVMIQRQESKLPKAL